MRILGISGSVRAGSHNTELLRVAAELLPPGAELELLEPEELKAVPAYDEDDDTGTPPAAVVRLRAAIGAADGVLFATPEYNGSVPGQLKNAIDWASRPARPRCSRAGPSLSSERRRGRSEPCGPRPSCAACSRSRALA